MGSRKRAVFPARWSAQGLLVLGLVLLLTIAPSRPAAGGGSLFVTVAGSGTACTQIQPCDLQTALAQATDGDAVYVAQGTYTGSDDEVARITASFSLLGGWNGVATGPVARDPGTFPTILHGEDTRRVVSIVGDVAPTLDGLRLVNGWTAGDGGGLYAAQGSPTIKNSQIYGNTADHSGGGVYINNSLGATLVGNWIQDNIAATFGGGVYVRNDPQVTLNHNSISRNHAQGGGAGVYLDNCDSAVLISNRILANISLAYAGGLQVVGSDGPSLAYNSIFGNQAGNQGGGLYINNSPNLVLTGNIISGNTSTASGGGLSISTQSHGALLTANLIVDNDAGGEGAGIYLGDSSPVTLVNNLVTDNRLLTPSRNGAGIYVNNSDISAYHTTITGNHGGKGQGICLQNLATASMTNTILVSQTVGLQADAGTSATLEATLWGAGVWANGDDTLGAGTILTGTLNLWGDPGFVAPFAFDYHLGPGSPALDQGLDAGVRSDVDFQPRPYLGFDLGADEYWPAGVLKHIYLPLLQE